METCNSHCWYVKLVVTCSHGFKKKGCIRSCKQKYMGDGNMFFYDTLTRCTWLFFATLFAIFTVTTRLSVHLHVQKPLASHTYKNLMTFGGCKQDFMLIVGKSSSTNTSKDKPTEKHLFAMDASKVCERSSMVFTSHSSRFYQDMGCLVWVILFPFYLMVWFIINHSTTDHCRHRLEHESQANPVSHNCKTKHD